MGKAVRVCADNFRRWTSNPRIYVIGILALVMIFQWIRAPILAFSNAVQVPVSPWLYPFLTEDWYISMMVQIGMVLLFCDAPFMNEGTAYLFVRAGRKNWFWGQVLYIALASLAYQVFLAASCALAMLPNLQWNADWGKVLGTLAQTTAGEEYGFPYIQYAIMIAYSPAQAMGLCLLLGWLVTMIFGMVIFTVNLFLPRFWGPIVGGAMTMVSSFALNFNGPALYWFSPGSWMTLSVISKPGLGFRPTLAYIATVGPVLIAALIAISYARCRKRAIETLPNL